MSRFTFNFYNDIRKPLKSGLYSIKVNLRDNHTKENINFTIKRVEGIEVSCSKSDWNDIWVNKDKKNSFGEIIGENNVYGDKMVIRTILKAKADILNDIISRERISVPLDVKKAFNNYVKPKVFKDDVYAEFDSKIKHLEAKDSYKTASVYLTTRNNVRKYNKSYAFRFSDITIEWLENYERTRRKVTRVSSVSLDIRNIRTVFNSAISKNKSLNEIYPFGIGKYQIPRGDSKNVGLVKEDLKKIQDFNSDNHYLQMARDYFLFSYYANGMNLKDIAKLKKGQTHWVRSKTEFTSKNEKRLDIDFNDEMLSIVSRHQGRGKMLFNVLEESDDIKIVTKKVNNKISSIAKQMKHLAKELDLPDQLSFQWARHSYATNVYRSGVNLKAISETLGHSSLKTTENYLNSLTDENKKAIDEAKKL